MGNESSIDNASLNVCMTKNLQFKKMNKYYRIQKMNKYYRILKNSK